MARGYLANLLNIPPLVFRFQFNPDVLQERRNVTYKEANGFGKWGFDKYGAATGLLKEAKAAYEDIKELGSLLVATKPLNYDVAEARTINLEFVLDATVGSEDEGFQPRNGGSILPDLAVLRSFVNPKMEASELFGLFKGNSPSKWNTPPECTLVYGGLSLTCVMTNLEVKMTAFLPDGKPSRAEVTAILREQTHSLDTVLDFVTRQIDVLESYRRNVPGESMREDIETIHPITKPLFKLFD